MILSSHAALGFSIGILVMTQTSDPLRGSLVAFGLGLASHHLADFVPHGHIDTNYKHSNLFQYPLVLLDVFGGVVLFTFLSFFVFGLESALLIVLSGIGGGIITDIISGLTYSKLAWIPRIPLLNLDDKLHKKAHWHGIGKTTRAMKWYDIWQFIIIAVALTIPFLFT